jgi:succinoglycan biosynthesis protein ExoA
MNDVLPVTIILPTLNERAFIRDCLDTLLSQDYSGIVEILVVDGGSTDGTQEIIAAVEGPIRLIDNPKMTAAAAMNLGIENCSTGVFVRVDCHTLYASDYVSKSVESFTSSGATVVGGPMRPEGANPFGRAVAAVTTSPFGIGNGRFHYAEELTEVETVYLGIFDKQFVIDVGGYDDVNLQWASEDQELNFRIRQAGGRILLNPAIRSVYFPRDSPRALARQYHNYGLCKASTLKKHRTLPYWRPLVPAGMVAGSISWSLMFAARRRPSIALVPYLLYGVGATVVATGLSRRSKPASFTNCLMALAICQWSYGIGFLEGMIRIVTKKPFDSRPREGRR